MFHKWLKENRTTRAGQSEMLSFHTITSAFLVPENGRRIFPALSTGHVFSFRVLIGLIRKKMRNQPSDLSLVLNEQFTSRTNKNKIYNKRAVPSFRWIINTNIPNKCLSRLIPDRH